MKKPILRYEALFVTMLFLLTSLSVFAIANETPPESADSCYEYFGQTYYTDEKRGEPETPGGSLNEQEPTTGWTHEIVDDDGDVGYGVDVDVDSLNCLHISYSHFSGGGGVKYAKLYPNGTKEIHVVDLIGGRIMTSIAVDQWNRPHITYFDWYTKCLKYALLTESGWRIEIVDDWLGNIDSICSPSIIVDSIGRPQIAYAEPAANSLIYATKRFLARPVKFGDNFRGAGLGDAKTAGDFIRPTDWVFETVQKPLSVQFYPLPSIAIDPRGNKLRIAYFGSLQLRQAVRVGVDNWYLDIANPDGGLNPALAVDAEGCSVISYMNGDSIMDDHKLMCARQDPWEEGWIIETLDGRFRSGCDSSIIMDENSLPHVASICFDIGDISYFHMRSPGYWDRERVGYIGGEVIWGPGMVSIVIKNAHPHIVYRSRTGDVHRLMHAIR